MGITSIAENNEYSIANVEEARLWVEREASAIHPAFGTRSDQSKAVWTPIKDFEVAIAKYKSEKEKKGKKVLFYCSATTPVTLNDVVKAAEKAQRKYEEDGANGIKKFRSKADYGSSIAVWLDLIPQNNCLTPLKGGLVRFLTAAAKISEARVKIMESFEDLTTMMQSALEKRNLYPDSEDLKDVAIKLYVTVFNALHEIISWFTQNAIKKYGVYLGKGPIAYKKLDDLLNRALRLRGAFNSKLSTLEGMVHRKTETSVARMMEDVPQIPLVRRDTVMLLQDTGSIKNELRSGRDEFQNFMKRDREWKKLQEVGLERAGLESKNWLIEQCLEIIKIAQWNPPRRSSTPPPDYSKEYVTQDQLFRYLCVDIAVVSLDVENNLRQCQAMEHSYDGQKAWLLRSQQFRDIISSQRSETLIIDGNADALESERVSPLSTLCAALLHSFKQSGRGPPISLSFFCGAHASSNDSLSSPTGIIRSLIAQLLRAWEFRFDFVHSHEYRAALECHDLKILCVAFEKLIYQLPAQTTVFCVVDGISLYERAELKDDLELVAATFQRLGQDSHLGCFFKSLITSPSQSLFFKQFFPRENLVSVPPRGNCDMADMSMDDAISSARSSSSSLHGSSIAADDGGIEYWSDAGFDSQDNEDG